MNSLVQSLLKLVNYPNSHTLICHLISYPREIPPQIGLLTNLKVLDFAENQLNGSITPKIDQLKSLNALCLYANHLHGCIPASLGNLSNLVYLFFNDNFLSCSIPSSLGNLSNLVCTHMIIKYMVLLLGKQETSPIQLNLT